MVMQALAKPIFVCQIIDGQLVKGPVVTIENKSLKPATTIDSAKQNVAKMS